MDLGSKLADGSRLLCSVDCCFSARLMAAWAAGLTADISREENCASWGNGLTAGKELGILKAASLVPDTVLGKAELEVAPSWLLSVLGGGALMFLPNIGVSVLRGSSLMLVFSGGVAVLGGVLMPVPNSGVSVLRGSS
jgi:hypothetical protein